MDRPTLRTFLLLASLTLGVASCGGDDGTADPGAPHSSSNSSSSSGSSSSSSSAGGPEPLVALPARVQAQNYNEFGGEDDTRNGPTSGACSQGTVDLDETQDNDGTCVIGWTQQDEWVAYNIVTNSDGEFDLIFRVASAFDGARLLVELDGVRVGEVEALNQGWDSYADRVLSKVNVLTGEHTIKVTFLDGRVNLNYIDIVDHDPSNIDPNPVDPTDPNEVDPGGPCTLHTPVAGLPNYNFTMHNVLTKTMARKDFCKADKWYSEWIGSNGKPIQEFSLHKGDDMSKHVLGGRKHARVEFEEGLKIRGSDGDWHELEARMLINKKPENTITIAQIFGGSSGDSGPDARVEIRTSGEIRVGSLKGGTSNVKLSPGNESFFGKSFKVKLRTNGRRIEIYFNDALKHEGPTRSSSGTYHFRWGLYSNNIPQSPEPLKNTVTELSVK